MKDALIVLGCWLFYSYSTFLAKADDGAAYPPNVNGVQRLPDEFFLTPGIGFLQEWRERHLSRIDSIPENVYLLIIRTDWSSMQSIALEALFSKVTTEADLPRRFGGYRLTEIVTDAKGTSKRTKVVALEWADKILESTWKLVRDADVNTQSFAAGENDTWYVVVRNASNGVATTWPYAAQAYNPPANGILMTLREKLLSVFERMNNVQE